MAAIFLAFSGSFSATQATLVSVKEATGEEPTAFTQRCLPRAVTSSGSPSSAGAAPIFSIKAAACDAELTSFHSMASRMTLPCLSRITMPCCCPPTASADTSSRPPACCAASWNASHQYEGLMDVPFGCLACPKRMSSPVSAFVTRTLQDCVEVSTPATKDFDMVRIASLRTPSAEAHGVVPV